MQNLFNCLEHPQEVVHSICMAEHDCKKILCAQCVYETHQNIRNDQIIPKTQFQILIAEKLQKIEPLIKLYKQEQQNWESLLKKVQQNYQQLMNDLKNYKEKIMKTFSEQEQLYQNFKKDLQTQQIFEFSKQQIQQMILLLKQNQLQSQNNNDYYSQVRKQIEVKGNNFINEMQILVELNKNFQSDDSIVNSLKSASSSSSTQNFIKNNQSFLKIAYQSQQSQQQSKLKNQTQQNNDQVFNQTRGRNNQIQKAKPRQSLSCLNNEKLGDVKNDQKIQLQDPQKSKFRIVITEITQ